MHDFQHTDYIRLPVLSLGDILFHIQANLLLKSPEYATEND